MSKLSFSIITPTFNTPESILARTWASLKAQTNDNWEWLIWDDSTNDSVWRQIYGFASDERYRINMHRLHVHSGFIGRLKRQLGMISNGDIIVELDHDDELTPNCLEELELAFADPEVGFVYSDWCEILPNGDSGVYPDGWAFGYGDKYWSDEYGVWVMKAPELNSTTLSHIVSAPNHVRAWRADVYRFLNGHNPHLPVADDYELILRTFLATKCLHIPQLLYKQYIGPSTAQRTRNDLIQTLVPQIFESFQKLILDRCEQLELPQNDHNV